MDLIIKTIPESKFTLSFTKDRNLDKLTVLDVKKELVLQQKIAKPELITLVFVGKLLKNNELLSKINVKHNTVLIMVLKKEEKEIKEEIKVKEDNKVRERVGDALNDHIRERVLSIANDIILHGDSNDIYDIRDTIRRGLITFKDMLIREDARNLVIDVLMNSNEISRIFNDNREALHRLFNDDYFVNDFLEIGRRLLNREEERDREEREEEEREERERDEERDRERNQEERLREQVREDERERLRIERNRLQQERLMVAQAQVDIIGEEDDEEKEERRREQEREQEIENENKEDEEEYKEENYDDLPALIPAEFERIIHNQLDQLMRNSEVIIGPHQEQVIAVRDLYRNAARAIAIGGVRVEEVGGVRVEEVGGVRVEEVGGVRAEQVGGVRAEEQVAQVERVAREEREAQIDAQIIRNIADIARNIPQAQRLQRPERQQIQQDFSEQDERNLASLINLGVSRDVAINRYLSCDRNVDVAANMIFD
jgi:hypothetical protein